MDTEEGHRGGKEEQKGEGAAGVGRGCGRRLLANGPRGGSSNRRLNWRLAGTYR
jgi:hypothetical protein